MKKIMAGGNGKNKKPNISERKRDEISERQKFFQRLEKNQIKTAEEIFETIYKNAGEGIVSYHGKIYAMYLGKKKDEKEYIKKQIKQNFISDYCTAEIRYIKNEVSKIKKENEQSAFRFLNAVLDIEPKAEAIMAENGFEHTFLTYVCASTFFNNENIKLLDKVVDLFEQKQQNTDIEELMVFLEENILSISQINKINEELINLAWDKEKGFTALAIIDSFLLGMQEEDLLKHKKQVKACMNFYNKLIDVKEDYDSYTSFKERKGIMKQNIDTFTSFIFVKNKELFKNPGFFKFLETAKIRKGIEINLLFQSIGKLFDKLPTNEYFWTSIVAPIINKGMYSQIIEIKLLEEVIGKFNKKTLENEKFIDIIKKEIEKAGRDIPKALVNIHRSAKRRHVI